MTNANSISSETLMRENDALRSRLAAAEQKLAEAHELIQAIQHGDVDAVVISGPAGEQVFSLKDAEYGYRALVEAMSEGAATVASDGTVLYCNERLSDLLGVPLETIIGNPLSKHLSGETEQVFEALLRQGISGESITTGLDLQTAQGRSIPVQISIREMISFESPVCCMVVTDLTESKARDELIAEGRLATLILQSTAEAIAVCDPGGKVIAGNQALEELCGCNPLYQPFDEVIRLGPVTSDESLSARELVAEALAGNTFKGRKARLTRNDGRVIPLLVSASSMRSSDGISGCVFTLTDITERELAMEALRQSELRFRLALTNAPVSIAMQDRDLVYRWAYNQRTRPPEEFIGKTDSDVFAPEEISALLELKRRVLRSGVPEHVQQWLTSNGQRLYFDLYHEPLRDVDGTITGLGVAIVDLTARKQAEEALRSSQEQLQAIIDGAPALVFLKDINGRYITVNSRVEELLGVTRGNVRGKTDYDLPTRQQADFYRANDQLVLTTGRPIQKEEAVLLVDGQTHTFLANKFPLVDASGKPYAICGISIDITERKRFEEDLRLTKERFEIALRNSPMVVFNQDLDLRYTWICNPGLGYRPEEVIGKRDSELFERPEDAAAIEAMKREVIRDGVGRRQEVIVHSMGTDRSVDLIVEPLHDSEGQIAGLTCAAIDITEKKQAEEELRNREKLAAQGEQLQALAAYLQHALEEERKKLARDLHDQIGQILTAIKMDMVWISRHLPDTESVVQDRIAASVILVNEGVRSVHHICSGLRPGILDDLGLAAAIEWQGNEFASRTGITFDATLPLGELQLDNDRAIAIFRIFQESLTNVGRHAEAQTIRVSLSQDNDDLLLIVEDDGKGFCESEVKGSLGLLGMKERAQACGGNVQVSSSPGQGTTVTVRVPLGSPDTTVDYANSDSR